MKSTTAAILLRRAVLARQSGRIQDTVELCLEVLRIDARNPQACRLLGEIALHGGLHAQAIEMLGLAVEGTPRDATLQVNLGAAYQVSDRFDKAEGCYRRALQLDPSLVQARGNLASVLADRGDDAAAEKEYRLVLDQNPRFADTHINLGNLLRNRGDLPKAIECYRNAVLANPMHPMAHLNLGGALLSSENWMEGWGEFEWRWQLGDNPTLRARHTLPLWQGDNLKRRHILLWGEQGIGDTVLFASMLPDLLRMGARITLELDARLVSLFQRSFPAIEVVSWGKVPSNANFDCQANIGRLGLFFRTTAESFANAKPYLRPAPDRVAAFRQRYRALDHGPVIGIAWESKSSSHRRKSLALADFVPLFRTLPDATFISLQYGDTNEEITRAEQSFGVRIIRDDSFDNWNDLDGLVAQIAALDRVVTVSNLNAHFAGAVGVPADVILTQNTLWYWPHRKAASPWYGSVTLVRLSDYDSVPAAMIRLADKIVCSKNAAAE